MVDQYLMLKLVARQHTRLLQEMLPATNIRLLTGELELGRFIPIPTRMNPTIIKMKAAKKKAFCRKAAIEITKNTQLIIKTISPIEKILLSITLLYKIFYSMQI